MNASPLLLAGRRALITGGAGRLGRAIALAFRREGAGVAITDVSGERLNDARRFLGDADVPLLTGDTALAGDVSRLVDEGEARLGAFDILVTCAAVYPNEPLLEMSGDDWDRVFGVNVRGAMLATQAVARRWIERGTRGSIVHLSSGAGTSARRGAAAYCGSKAALNMLVEVAALELGPHGIRVNAVAPGLVMDDVVSAESSERADYYNLQLRATPLGRTGAPAEIADAVVFLASDRSRWTTGAILNVSGGAHCGRAHLDFTRTLGQHLPTSQR